jgi:hypothetical protein
MRQLEADMQYINFHLSPELSSFPFIEEERKINFFSAFFGDINHKTFFPFFVLASNGLIRFYAKKTCQHTTKNILFNFSLTKSLKILSFERIATTPRQQIN